MVRYLWIPVVAMVLGACVLPQPAIGADEADAPGDAAVIAAIKAMFDDPFSAQAAEAQKVVVDFSQGSDKVKVIVARGLGFYPGNIYSETLLAHYIAGVVKFDLDNPAKAADERLGIQAGLEAALNVYKKIRRRDDGIAVPSLDAAEESVGKGSLSAFIGEALARAKQERGAAK
jgi:hypothetical protein